MIVLSESWKDEEEIEEMNLAVIQCLRRLHEIDGRYPAVLVDLAVALGRWRKKELFLAENSCDYSRTDAMRTRPLRRK